MLCYEPQPLKFGTSGRRGEVVHLTQLEIYINATAEIQYLQSLPPEDGGIRLGEEFFYASDLRPSSRCFVPEQGGRGEIAQAIEQAIRDAGMRPVNLGLIPTPALTCYAIARGRGSMMITGSHIPFDRNGYKTNTALGELLKKDEAPINARVEQVRRRLYDQAAGESMFGADGRFKDGHRELLPVDPAAREAYIRRYTDFFAGKSLKGMRLLAYQHSAVGRDLLVELLRRLGAEVIPAGRSETFVPIDTEAIDAAQLAVIQDLAATAWRKYGRIDAVVSTDGDSDRPLILSVEPAAVPMPSPNSGCDDAVVPDGETPCRVRFFGGDLVGMIVAEYLRADAVVVPISCNDALDRSALKDIVEPKTRIGSPFVIAGMQQAREKGRRAVCGWEANGGFLTGSDITRDGRTLAALPTRDAMLPILGALFSAKEKGVSLSALFDRLPARFSKAALLRKFPRATSLKIVQWLSPDTGDYGKIRDRIARFFRPEDGFGGIERLDHTDGVRIYFDNGEVAHIRPSGNADELRIYALADTQARADAIAMAGVAEPDGILRQLERAVASDDTGLQPLCPCEPRLVRLLAPVQHYDWGGFEFLPSLLGIAAEPNQPCAELWMGAHPKAPATAQLGEASLPLTELIASAPADILGQTTSQRFSGKLPYLFKLLDARKMLSIQAHPTLEQAQQGFARENAAGIALDAPNRNYKDDNHKPEVHVALTEFWMLHGFRPIGQIAEILRRVPEFTDVYPALTRELESRGADMPARAALLRGLYETIMTMPQERVDAILAPLIQRLCTGPQPDKNTPEFWAIRAARQFPLPGGHFDRGIFSIYLLNLVRLQPGQGTYQPAGTLHAYLEGVNVELMANSDNVLRGGLTPKHVDVPELLRIVNFSDGVPEVLHGEIISPVETVYRTPAAEFELSRIQVTPTVAYAVGSEHSADILVVLDGQATVRGGSDSLPLSRGQIVLVPAGLVYTVQGQATLYKAGVPRR